MSRRDQIKLSDEEIRDFLKSSRTMILVSNGKDGYPHPMPMWYHADDNGDIFMTTFRKSQKINNLKRDPKVSLLVESGEVYQELKGLVIYAEAEVVDDVDYTAGVMFNLSVGRGDARPEQKEAVVESLKKNAASKRVAIRFKPTKVVSWDHAKLAGKY